MAEQTIQQQPGHFSFHVLFGYMLQVELSECNEQLLCHSQCKICSMTCVYEQTSTCTTIVLPFLHVHIVC